ncbi:MAG: hypothetical protein INR72_16390 [Williamsia herbipolensis]|nr:hypothetical protein [Williamsia herbipolensis]
MPTWLVLTLAALVLLAGALLPSLRFWRARTAGFREQLSTARAEVDALRYRIDTAGPTIDVRASAEAAATAEALLAAARPARSTAVCRQVDALLEQARADLDAAERDRRS